VNPLAQVDARHFRLLSWSMFTGTLRSGPGILCLILTLLVGLGTAAVVLEPMDMMLAANERDHLPADQAGVMRTLVQFSTPMVSWLVAGHLNETAGQKLTPAQQSDADQWAHYLLQDRPAPLSAVYMILCFSLPFLIALGAFDQVSSDINARRLRFLLPRAQRATIFLGRACGMMLFMALLLAVVMAIIATYLASSLPLYPLGSVIGWSVRCYLMLVAAAIPAVALCSLISASVSSAFASLALCNTVFCVVPLAPLVIRLASGTTWSSLITWLLPLPFQLQLFHFSPWHVAAAILGCLAYAAGYLLLGLWIFGRRDL